jgi:hypothetical protein
VGRVEWGRDATICGANAQKNAFAEDRGREAGRSRRLRSEKLAKQARCDAIMYTTNLSAWATGGDRLQ